MIMRKFQGWTRHDSGNYVKIDGSTCYRVLKSYRGWTLETFPITSPEHPEIRKGFRTLAEAMEAAGKEGS
jgi:hypothetical protein